MNPGDGAGVSGWHQISVIEELATAGSGAANAIYFTGRALRAHTVFRRRTAALVLAMLFLGSALSPTASYAGGGSGEGVIVALARLPLFAGNVGAFTLILAGGGR
jgi:hypothetical protein